MLMEDGQIWGDVTQIRLLNFFHFIHTTSARLVILVWSRDGEWLSWQMFSASECCCSACSSEVNKSCWQLVGKCVQAREQTLRAGYIKFVQKLSNSTFSSSCIHSHVKQLQKVPQMSKFQFFLEKPEKIQILDSQSVIHSRKLLPLSLISCVYSYAVVCTWLYV